jgi:hypothetical protein
VLHSSGDGWVSMWHDGMTLVGAVRNTLRNPTAVVHFYQTIPHRMSRLALYLNGLIVETFPVG